MDSDAFDRLARRLGTPGSRRTALAALFGIGALGVAPAAAKKPRRGRDRSQMASQVLAGLRACPNPGPGQNLSKCDFSHADLRGRSLRGANLSGARLVGAELCGVDLRGANLHKTDFTGAHLTRADLRGTNLATAILTDARFCQTKRPNGKLDHTHCPPQGTDVCCGDSECDGVCQRGACLERSCHNLGQLCEAFVKPAGNCCSGVPQGRVECNAEADILTYTCQTECSSDTDCAPFGDFECVADFLHCPQFKKCCRTKLCRLSHPNDDCPSGKKCCPASAAANFCCRGDQTCGVPPATLVCLDR